MKLKNLISLLIVSFLFINAGVSQTVPVKQGSQGKAQDIEVSDSELETFIKVSTELQQMQMQARQRMGKIIKDNGMEMKRYQEIARAKQQGQEVEMTKKEEKAYAAIQKEMKKEGQGMQKDMQKILKKHEMKQKRFQQIAQALRSDKELQNRFKKVQQKYRQKQQPKQEQ
jgi:hypothetical protein